MFFFHLNFTSPNQRGFGSTRIVVQVTITRDRTNQTTVFNDGLEAHYDTHGNGLNKNLAKIKKTIQHK